MAKLTITIEDTIVSMEFDPPIAGKQGTFRTRFGGSTDPRERARQLESVGAHFGAWVSENCGLSELIRQTAEQAMVDAVLRKPAQ